MDFGMIATVAIRSIVIVTQLSLLCLLLYCIYQLYFHPLAKYPGPFLAKFTNLYSAYHAFLGDIHVDILKCHQKHGDVVRYAPNRIVFISAEAAADIYGNRSNVVKSKVYTTLVHRSENTLTLRDKAEHLRRRRVMSPGFSDASIKLLEPKILTQVNLFVQALTGQLDSGEYSAPRDMARWCDRHGFDLMTNLIYSASLHTLGDTAYRYVPGAIEGSNVRMSVILQAPELLWRRIDKKLFPTSIVARNRLLGFLQSIVKKRRETRIQKGGDIFSLLENAVDPETGKGFNITELLGESATLIPAGSDTTSTTLAGLFHYLSQDSNIYERAVNEVRAAFPMRDDIKIGTRLASCTFLRACIDETLRMSPPTGSALWREVCYGGQTVAGRFIPAGCDVGVGVYAIQHNAVLFPEPFEFRPDRFFTKDQQQGGTTGPRRGFMPFSLGTRGCIGKGLALQELMLTMATLLWTCDFQRAEDDDTPYGEYRLLDHITGSKTGPRLRFRLRDIV